MKIIKIENYTNMLLKKKPYFINELYQKLLIKYEPKVINSEIKKLIIENKLNDKKLVEIYVNNFIYVKKVGKNYIINYLTNKNISINLIHYILDKYENVIFENNKNELIEKYKDKGVKYVNDYLRRKGYDIDE